MSKILTLVGNGKMASALALGLEDSFELEVIGRDEHKISEFVKTLKKKPITLTFEKLKSIDKKTLIFCVKPYAIDSISLDGEADALISVMAGVSLEKLEERYKAKRYLRAMPNIAAQYGKSATAITGDEELRALGMEIFSKIGSAIWVESENELNIATALAGSAPAFLAVAAEALIDAGVKEGLKRDDAKSLAQALFVGFGELLLQKSATEIKESVMSPGGTTAAGIAALERAGARSAFFEAIKESSAKAKELSKN